MRSFIRSNHRVYFRSQRGFTLLELLATLAVTILIMVAIVEFVTEVERAWKSTSTDPFAEAENAFEIMAENLATATLEPYQDYADRTGTFRTSSSTSFVPDHLARRSDLDFVCAPSAGAHGLLSTTGRITSGSAVFFLTPQGYTQTYAHTGMERLLNAVGYFVEFGNDDALPTFILPGHPRWRLKQILQPTELLQIYAPVPSANPLSWIQNLTQAGAPTSVLADNIVTMIVLPELTANNSAPPLASDFHYDSRDVVHPPTLHQLPPRLRLILVAMDESSARILANRYGSSPPLLVPAGLFNQASQLNADLSTLDNSLTAQKIGHRIFQREILLTAAAWSNTPSP